MYVAGRPAVHPTRLLLRASVALAGWGLAAAAAPVALVVSPLPVRFQVALSLVAVAVAVVQVHQRRVKVLQAWVGVRAEWRVARALRSCKWVAVVHGAVLDHGDIDHVVAGPGVAVVETKAGRGPVSVDHDGAVRAGRKRLGGDAIAQARRMGRQVQRAVGTAPLLVVCVADGEGSTRAGDVWVCGPAELPYVLSHAPRCLSPQDALALARSLPVAAGRDGRQ